MTLLDSLQLQGFRFTFTGDGYLSCELSGNKVDKETMDMIAENIGTLADQLSEQQEKDLRARITT